MKDERVREAFSTLLMTYKNQDHLEERVKVLESALRDVLNMLEGLKPDFSNGNKVWDSTLDEGEVLASGVLDRARAALYAESKK